MTRPCIFRNTAISTLILLVFLAGCGGSAILLNTRNFNPTPGSAAQVGTTASAPAQAAAATISANSGTSSAPSTPAGAAPSITATAAAGRTLFDGHRAYQDVLYQMSLGPRTPGSEAHAQVIDWIKAELEKNSWQVEVQETTRMGHPVRNVVAQRGDSGSWTVFGAHFDSRLKADQDKDLTKRGDPVPAANDGASGVAVLLELARVLPKDLNQRVTLLFIDAEDQGELPGWDWLLGSRAYAEALTKKPDAVVIIDMIGDADLNIKQEKNSDPALTREIWDVAKELGYSSAFIAQPGWGMIDDHTPFLEKNIRAIDIIDFDYPYWHTTQDTSDKVSAGSLQIVGDTLLAWLTRATP